MTSLDIKNLTFPPNCPKKLTCSLAKQRTNPLKPGLSVHVYCNILDHTAVAILKCLDTYMLSYMYICIDMKQICSGMESSLLHGILHVHVR